MGFPPVGTARGLKSLEFNSLLTVVSNMNVPICSPNNLAFNASNIEKKVNFIFFLSGAFPKCSRF